MLTRYSLACLFACAALASRAVAALADDAAAGPSPAASHAAHPAPATTHVPAGSELVRVSSCSTKNVNPQGGNGMLLYVNGNAGNNWYGNDVYGNTYYQPAASTAGPHLLITFTNISHKPMKTIEFGLLLNQLLSGEAHDSGDFAPGAEIKHKLGLHVSAQLPGPERCVPLTITFADGTHWRNPRLPPHGKAYYNSEIPPKPMH